MSLHNLARMTSTTTGTGTLTLVAAVTGCLTFANAGVADGEIVSYGISDGANAEVGVGVYSSTGPTLARTTVHSSTNSGNLIDCTGSQHVFITPTASDFLQLNGWREVKHAWTYASTTTITVPSGAAAIYEVGNRIKLTNSTVKYFVIVGVADTLLTVTGGTDYAMADAAISAIYVSDGNPPDFPAYFNWNGATGANWQGFTGGLTENTYFWIDGRKFSMRVGVSGTSNATSLTGTAPVAPASGDLYFIVQATNNTSTKSAGMVLLSGTTMTAYTSFVEAGWTASGTKRIAGTIDYVI
jgi:hypothetical protein